MSPRQTYLRRGRCIELGCKRSVFAANERRCAQCQRRLVRQQERTQRQAVIARKIAELDGQLDHCSKEIR